jgi:hypothetical protein
VADTWTQSVRVITTSGGVVTTLAGGKSSSAAGYTDGTGLNALFNYPRGITIDTSGNLYVADTMNLRIREWLSSASQSLLPALLVAIAPTSWQKLRSSRVGRSV